MMNKNKLDIKDNDHDFGNGSSSSVVYLPHNSFIGSDFA